MKDTCVRCGNEGMDRVPLRKKYKNSMIPGGMDRVPLKKYYRSNDFVMRYGTKVVNFRFLAQFLYNSEPCNRAPLRKHYGRNDLIMRYGTILRELEKILALSE